MKSKFREIDTMHRRTFLLGGAKLALVSALAGRLYHLQMYNSDVYKTLAEDNRVRLNVVLPARGQLTDRNDRVLADNIPRYQLWIEPMPFDDLDGVFERASEYVSLSDNDKSRVQKAFKKRSYKPALLKDHLSWEEFSTLNVHISAFPNVSMHTNMLRHYPFGEYTGHVIGYVGAPKQSDIDRDKIYKQPEVKIGKRGIEKIMEPMLRGSAGIKRVEVNARGAHVRDLSIEEALRGRDIEMSLDINLQKYVSDKMAGMGGIRDEGSSAVVLDIETGEVRAMVSRPTFDPNAFLRGISHKEWEALIKNPDAPLVNKAISTPYPPGSTLKLPVALAAMKSGAVSTSTQYYCNGSIQHGNRVFRCWNKDGHGNVDLKRALAQSCNIYFYRLSQNVGIENIAEMCRLFGLGTETGIEMNGEHSGLIPDKAWKRGMYNRSWHTGDTMNAAIGQGYMLTTPLQLAIMVARIASGKQVEPTMFTRGKLDHIINSYNERIDLPWKPGQFADLAIDRHHLHLIRSAMAYTVNSDQGTGYRTRIKSTGLEMAGKTGTSQVRQGFRDEESALKRLRNHSLFVGYAPVHKPKYAVSVIIEHGGYGSVAAAPVARDILYKAQTLKALPWG